MPREASQASSAVSSTADVENGTHFDDNNPRFYVFSLVHCRLASVLSCLFGCLCVIGIFVFFVCHFQWYFYDTAVDVVVLTGISIFLVFGNLVHYLALRGIHKEKPFLLNPFIGFHLFLALIEVIIALTAIGELVSDQTPQLEVGDMLARSILFVVPLIIFIQIMMLCCVIKYKYYLHRKLLFIKRNHANAITQVMYGNGTVEIGENGETSRRETLA